MKVALLSIAIIAVVLSVYFSASSRAENLAQCLTDNGVEMYGAEWCPQCVAQKNLFGRSFRLVSYIDCDVDEDACVEAKIEGFPTWIIDEETALLGARQLQELAQTADCLNEYAIDVGI